jgi:heme exporter protein B
MTLIEGRALACLRGERLVFQDISFELNAGDILIVTGANGSGKSSLLRMIAGLLRPEAGAIKNSASFMYLGHQDGLKPVETPRESVSFRAALQGVHADPDTALAAMGMMPMAHTCQRYLSAGQRRRTALAGVIAGGAMLWLLDEPTAALDAESKALLLAALASHRDAGGMAIITTHETLEVEGAKQLDLVPSPSGRGQSGEALRSRMDEGREPHYQLAPHPNPLPLGEGTRRGGLIILLRDLRLTLRQGGQVVTTLLFFLLIIMVLALGVGPDAVVLRGLAPGAIWTAVLLASLLSLERLFAADAEDGSLDQLRTGTESPEGLALGKIAAHFLTTGVPLALLTPLAAFFLALPFQVLPVLIGAVLLGSATLSLIGGAIAALLVGARRGGLLSALLALPLYVPVLIFGAGAIEKTLAGASPAHPLLLLGALLALALPLAPIAAAAALEE